MTKTHQSLYELFKETSNHFPERIAISYISIKLKYKELLDCIDKTVEAFRKHGVKEGDVVSISLPSLPESVMCFYALNKIGAIPCMIDVRYTPAQMCEIIDRTHSKMVFIMGFSCIGLAEVENQLHVEKVVVCSGADSIPGVSTFYALGEWFNGRRTVFRKHKKFSHWKDFIKTAQGNDRSEPYHWKSNEMAALFHTSGTTGTVKSVMLTTENILHSTFPKPPVLNDIANDDTVLCCLPIFAFFGANTLILAFSYGMRAVVVPIVPHEAFLKTVIKHKPQHIFSVPAYWDVLAKEQNNQEDFSYLKTINIAGDTLNATYEKSINDFLHARGCRYDITKGYGMTETSGIISYTPQGNPHQYELGFSGKAVGGYEVKTFDGEICVHSSMELLGYYKNEAATQALIQTHEGKQWLHTGDMGYVDDEGNIFLIGRKKRMIVRHDGSKVFPVEIETCLAEHLSVASCAVVPMQDPNHSESKLPKAFVVLKDPNQNSEVTIEKLMTYCEEHLPEHLVPAAIAFIEKIPVNTNGKVDYQKLLSY